MDKQDILWCHLWFLDQHFSSFLNKLMDFSTNYYSVYTIKASFHTFFSHCLYYRFHYLVLICGNNSSTNNFNVTFRLIHLWRFSSSPIKSMRSPSSWLPCKYRGNSSNFSRFCPNLRRRCFFYLLVTSQIFMSIDLISAHKGSCSSDLSLCPADC